MTDALEALITYLKTDATLTALVSTRVYGGELPSAEIPSMSRKVVVVRASGGPDEIRTSRTTRTRFDVYSYGEGYLEAGKVDRAVADALMALQRGRHSSTLLHSAGYGGPLQLKEPDHGWPFVARSVLVLFDERTAAA